MKKNNSHYVLITCISILVIAIILVAIFGIWKKYRSTCKSDLPSAEWNVVTANNKCCLEYWKKEKPAVAARAASLYSLFRSINVKTSFDAFSVDISLSKNGQLLIKYTVNYGHHSGSVDEKYVVVFLMENKEVCPVLVEWTVQADFWNKLDIMTQFSNPLFPYCRDNYQWMQNNNIESFMMITDAKGISFIKVSLTDGTYLLCNDTSCTTKH